VLSFILKEEGIYTFLILSQQRLINYLMLKLPALKNGRRVALNQMDIPHFAQVCSQAKAAQGTCAVKNENCRILKESGFFCWSIFIFE